MKTLVLVALSSITLSALADSEPPTTKVKKANMPAATVRFVNAECGDTCAFNFVDKNQQKNYVLCSGGDMQPASKNSLCKELSALDDKKALNGKVATILVRKESKKGDVSYWLVGGKIMPNSSALTEFKGGRQ